jgi:hypothetical protein
VLKKHISIPSKDNNFLSSFLVTLKNVMDTMSQDATTYEVTLEDLLFRRVIRIVSYHDVWIAYFKDKDEGHVHNIFS